MAQDHLSDFINTRQSHSQHADSEDIYRLYQREMKRIPRCTPEEETRLLGALLNGDKRAADRLVEGRLETAVRLAQDYQGRGLSMNDLVQEANMGLLLAVREYTGGDFAAQAETRIRDSIEEALALQDTEQKVGEELAARVNVLKDISASMVNELGREATVAELAERMRMTEEEIKDIMKLTLDALSVSGEGL